MKATRRAYDVAYGCFLLLAVVMLFLVYLRSSFTDAEWANGGGGIFFILLPLIVIPIAATIVGIVLSMRLWNHWPLPALAVGWGLIIAESFIEFGSEAFQKCVYILYALVVAAMSGLWFLGGRRHSPPAAAVAKE
jgi:hypothetical protein